MKTTYENAAALIENGNKKEIYDTIYFAAKLSRIDATAGVAGIIVEFLRDCSTTFVSDIAKKYIEYGNCSEKQAWCMTFEVIKIQHMLAAWIEKEIESINNL